MGASEQTVSNVGKKKKDDIRKSVSEDTGYLHVTNISDVRELTIKGINVEGRRRKGASVSSICARYGIAKHTV